MTIEELQILSKCLLLAAGMMAVVAVILFVHFDIRNIWGLVIKHANGYMVRQDACVVKSVKNEPNMEEETGKEIQKGTQIETQIETVPLVTTQKIELKAEQETMLLGLTKNNMHIFQDITCIHTDIRIN